MNGENLPDTIRQAREVLARMTGCGKPGTTPTLIDDILARVEAGTRVPEERPTYHSDAMTWFNGRAIKIEIADGQGGTKILWDLADRRAGITVEDAIRSWVNIGQIDMLKEIGDGES